MRLLAAILTFGAVGTAVAVSQWIEVATTAEISHQSGDARWVSWTDSFTRERCAPPGSPLSEGTDRDFFNCLAHNLHLRNVGTMPVQCRLDLELTAPNHEGHTREGADVVVFAGNRGRVSSVGASTSLIASHATSCVAIPMEPPPLIVAAGCRADVQARDIDPFYPRSAIGPQQEGTVQVEYSTVADRQWTENVTVVRSSGVESLDQAALRYMRSVRVTSNCPGQRFRYDVVFKLSPLLREMYRPQILQ